MISVEQFKVENRSIWIGVIYGDKIQGVVYSLEGEGFLKERIEELTRFLRKRGADVRLEEEKSTYPQLVFDVLKGKLDNEEVLNILSFEGTTLFERKVYEVLTKKVKRGQVISYKELAHIVGSSPRAIGGAMKRNPYPIIVPCHRVISSNGIGFYTPKVEYKKFLLEIEGVKKWTS
ncbi:hypothetical protein PAP_09550 [Palaeococcus pacificus DY20341]|uniref:Methylated-DNA--protein-cysteine methyltransferase n=1 Tax=Palaeococcus pacificus DY20341 TaxID=1343739 RepID=A0A075LU92_9EURY|nr:methylated-DNA--protein-cysteine methyltransferase [Palaeococcus pacificus]AIF70285.1 hypothetical protein PAP_09550 [Palaeococcus pacificus DY20341]